MESTKAKRCSICRSATKYRCMDCQIPICNVCAIEENDDSKTNWIPGKQVGRCCECNDESISGPDSSEIHSCGIATPRKKEYEQPSGAKVTNELQKDVR